MVLCFGGSAASCSWDREASARGWILSRALSGGSVVVLATLATVTQRMEHPFPLWLPRVQLSFSMQRVRLLQPLSASV
jgi:hypothetical protein